MSNPEPGPVCLLPQGFRKALTHALKAPFHCNQILAVGQVHNGIDVAWKRGDERAHKVISHGRLPVECSCWDVEYDVVRIARILFSSVPVQEAKNSSTWIQDSRHLDSPLLRAPGDGWQSVQIQADPVSGPYDLDNTGEVQRRQRLGGLLNYYYRAAA